MTWISLQSSTQLTFNLSALPGRPGQVLVGEQADLVVRAGSRTGRREATGWPVRERPRALWVLQTFCHPDWLEVSALEQSPQPPLPPPLLGQARPPRGVRLGGADRGGPGTGGGSGGGCLPRLPVEKLFF